MKRLSLILVTILALALIWMPVYAANIFTENFDVLNDDDSIETTNTAFDYVRIGDGGGSITAKQAVSGEMHMRLGGSSSTSLNGVGIKDSLGDGKITTLNFRVKLEDKNGTFFIGVGKGTRFTGDSTFATNQLMWGIQFKQGAVEYRTDTWESTGQSLSVNTNYEFHIVANRSGSTVNYGSNSVENGKMDLFIDGILVGDDLDIANNQDAAGFRIYQVAYSGETPSYARFDSITIDNTALAPFTPNAVTLASVNALSPFVALSTALLLAAGLVLLRR